MPRLTITTGGSGDTDGSQIGGRDQMAGNRERASQGGWGVHVSSGSKEALAEMGRLVRGSREHLGLEAGRG